MLTACRVRNLRCIKDSEFLEVRPIVVLVGKNSSGKSTLLRLFPLLKQSVSEDTREPLLWYGRSVDFGSFDEAVRRDSEEKEISFEFRFDFTSTAGQEVVLLDGGERIFFSRGRADKFFVAETPPPIELALTVARRAQTTGTFTKAVEVRVGEDRLLLEANEEGLVSSPIFNGVRIDDAPNAVFQFVKGKFFPNLASPPQVDPGSGSIPLEQVAVIRGGPYAEYLVNVLRPYAHGNTVAKTLRGYAQKLLFGSREEFKNHFGSIAKEQKWKLRELPDTRTELDRVRAAAFLRHLPRIFYEASQQLSAVGSGVRYLEPVRARASRYYRFQELAIDEIDPQGENVPMFLSSLGYEEQRNLETWMGDALGFQVRATREGGHAKLLVKEAGSSSETNLADTGFGYSQVLPIILQLWKSERDAKRMSARKAVGRQQIVAIEQPELHLHPHFQALLADVLAVSVKASKTVGSPLSIILETHSEHLVNRLGALVEKGKLSPSDIGVYLVDREESGQTTRVQHASFSKQGTLTDPWPFGFFAPSLD